MPLKIVQSRDNVDRQMGVDQDLADLLDALSNTDSIKKKVELVEQFRATQEFLSNANSLQELFLLFPDREKFILYATLALGQGPHIFKKGSKIEKKDLEHLVRSLLPVEEFYREIGGIIGYHLTCLELLAKKGGEVRAGKFYPPKALDISEETDFTRDAVICGIRCLDQMAEIYPLGGAADRLSLSKEEPSTFQIAATLEFCGKTLLEHLIEDLQAREFLHYKLFAKQICIPVILMTSDEKGGSFQVQTMFKEKNWFGRRQEDFFFFSQPLVPTMDNEGRWCAIGPGQLFFKPGGHGVIWKLAKESGAFDWLRKRGRAKALMRQINNLVASVDYALMAFLGIGFDEDKDFGFAACPCAKGVSEGVNVVIESEKGCSLTNIEYCEKTPALECESESALANTNLLFVDIDTIEELLEISPIPGMLVNAKKMKYRDGSGMILEKEIIRLESTMQNIADALIEPGRYPLEMRRSFITSNIRKKTISTIKKEFAFGSSMLQTPEQCYIDILENGRDLLVNYCDFQVPVLNDSMSFFQKGPSFIFLYHPALGPLYQIIRQKLKKGRLAVGSELKLQISDLYVEGLDIDGSLEISTDSIMGHQDENGVVQYSDETGKCILKNVRVRNSGINREASRSFWKDEIAHKEKCEIFIEQGGEFFAENVLFRGEVKIRVPSGVKVTAFMKEGRLELFEEVLEQPSWNWEYRIDAQSRIILEHKQ